MAEVNDKLMLAIADDIGVKIMKIAAELEIEEGVAERCEMRNTIGNVVSTAGTRDLLSTWRDDTPAAQQQPKLNNALKKAGFKGIAAKHFSHLPQESGGETSKGHKRPTEGGDSKALKKLKGDAPSHSGMVHPSDNKPGLGETSVHQQGIEPDVDGLYTLHKIAPAKHDLDKHEPESTYDTWKSAKKGSVLIINNNNFPNFPKKSRRRPGSEIDVRNVRHVFSELGYKPVVKEDLASDEILDTLDEIVSEINANPDKHSSLCLVIMSHGNRKGICGTDTRIGDPRLVTIDEIKKKLSGGNCKALVGKPKLIFIQACRGKEATLASDLDSESSESKSQGQGASSDVEVDDVSINYNDVSDVDVDGGEDLPDNTDIFVANGTSNGFYSIRDKKEGSWFIQALSEVFLRYARIDDINELMRKVTCRVTEHFKTKKGVRQTPAFESQGMRKRFYFFPKYGSDDEAM